ncbi:hypothetical protein [Burkholderia anthina]|uniref:hypothetical protein n=1 Tax=Burkholderia anthina TaxID=179879 RepID=UPI00158EFC99
MRHVVETLRGKAQSALNTVGDPRRKPGGQRRAARLDHLRRRDIAEQALFSHLGKVPTRDVAHHLVLAPAVHGHRELRVVPQSLIRTVAFDRPDRHHGVGLREAETSARQQAQAEALRMPVRPGKYPEHNERAEQCIEIRLRGL